MNKTQTFSTVSAGRKQVKVVCNPVTISIAQSTSKMTKARSIRATAQGKYPYVLHYRTGEQEYYYFSAKSGISISRQIEHYLEVFASDSQAIISGDCAFCLEFDSKVYLARLSSGVVEDEQVLIPSAARSVLDSYEKEGLPVYWSSVRSTGRNLSLPETHEVSNFEFSLSGVQGQENFRYKSLLMTMTRARLYHPKQVVIVGACLAVAAVGIGGSVFYSDQVRQAADFVTEQQQLQAQREAERRRDLVEVKEASHGAYDNLDSLAKLYSHAYSLLGYGIVELAWSRNDVVMTGNILRNAASELSEQYPVWDYRLTENGWVLSRKQLATPNIKSITVSSHEMHRHIDTLERISNTDISIIKITRNNGNETVEFSLEVVLGVTHLLGLLGQEMRDLPYRLNEALCRFDQWRSTGCTLTFTLKYAE